MKENAGFFYVLIETDFLHTHSHFLPANQNALLTRHNQSNFVWCHSRVSILSSKHSCYQWECAYFPNYFIKWLHHKNNLHSHSQIFFRLDCFYFPLSHRPNHNLKQRKVKNKLLRKIFNKENLKYVQHIHVPSITMDPTMILYYVRDT